MQKNTTCFIFVDRFVFQHTTVWRMRHILSSSSISKVRYVFGCTVKTFDRLDLTQRSTKSCTNAICCRVTPNYQHDGGKMWVGYDWMKSENYQPISHGKIPHMGWTILVYNIYFVLWPRLGTEICKVVRIWTTMSRWVHNHWIWRKNCCEQLVLDTLPNWCNAKKMKNMPAMNSGDLPLGLKKNKSTTSTKQNDTNGRSANETSFFVHHIASCDQPLDAQFRIQLAVRHLAISITFGSVKAQCAISMLNKNIWRRVEDQKLRTQSEKSHPKKFSRFPF